MIFEVFSNLYDSIIVTSAAVLSLTMLYFPLTTFVVRDFFICCRI